MSQSRRTLFVGAALAVLGSLGIASSPVAAQAQDQPAEIRIGTQKGGFFPAVRQRRTLEEAFKPLGIEIKWIDFSSVRRCWRRSTRAASISALSAIPRRSSHRRAGRGFATWRRSSRKEITRRSLCRRIRPIKTLADLRGKRIAFGKGSSAHNLLVVALEKGGLAWGDITLAALAPADATAAFVQGSVDAWSNLGPLSRAG